MRSSKQKHKERKKRPTENQSKIQLSCVLIFVSFLIKLWKCTIKKGEANEGEAVVVVECGFFFGTIKTHINFLFFLYFLWFHRFFPFLPLACLFFF